MSITEFLLARIAEDEAAANGGSNVDHRKLYHYGAPLVPKRPSNWKRMLAECKAKRAIVELADDATSLDASVDNDRRVGIRDEAVEPYCGDSILYALAAVYADHKDYQSEWKVGA